MRSDVREWFQEAVNWPAAQRVQRLTDSCPDDEVRAEVLSLLQHDQETDTTFAGSVRAVAAKMDHLNGIGPGLRLGVFELGRLLGQGGMGRVFEAHRIDNQIDQTVAIKFFDLALADKKFRETAVARFLQERRILATLQHPHIAALLDVGTVNDIPYFVMERVHGMPIDTFVEHHALGTRACIELVLKVIEGVERAHQNLIVHRDIKPGNILVTDDGTPKLLDFGIAKDLFNHDGTHTLATPWTPDYASPEQIAGHRVTVATDVYGLGGLLYRLLTGHPPHALIGRVSADWLRLVLEEDVKAPSIYRPELRGDLENILRTALHKDPARRYESAGALADDLRRFLKNRPVRATPDSLAYRTRMVLRRNKLLTGAVTLAVASLIVGSAVSLHQGALARRRFNQVRQLANVFLFDFERSIRDVPGTLDARNLVASTAQRYLEQLAAESGGDDSLQREIAAAYERLATVQGSLQAGGGKSPAETESLLRSIQILRRLGDHQSTIPSLHRKYIELSSRLADRLQDGKNARAAFQWADESMRLGQAWVDAEPSSADALAAATTAFMRAGTTYEIAGQIDRALTYLEKSAAFGKRALDASPEDDAVRILVASAERVLSELLQTLKRYPEAVAHGRRSLDLITPLWQKNPSDRLFRNNFLAVNSALGIALRGMGESDPRQFAAGLPYLRKAYEIARENMLADARNTRSKSSFVAHTHRLCSLLQAMKRYDEASALYQKGDSVARELTTLDPGNRRSWYLLGKNQLDFGWMLLTSGDPAHARRSLLAASDGFTRALQMDPQDTVVLECRAGQFEGLALAALKSGDRAEARRWMSQGLDVMRDMVRRDPSVKNYIDSYDNKLKLALQLGLSKEGLE